MPRLCLTPLLTRPGTPLALGFVGSARGRRSLKAALNHIYVAVVVSSDPPEEHGGQERAFSTKRNHGAAIPRPGPKVAVTSIGVTVALVPGRGRAAPWFIVVENVLTTIFLRCEESSGDWKPA